MKLLELYLLEANCPNCGKPGAYVGLNTVECPHCDPSSVDFTPYEGVELFKKYPGSLEKLIPLLQFVEKESGEKEEGKDWRFWMYNGADGDELVGTSDKWHNGGVSWDNSKKEWDVEFPMTP